MMKNRSDAIRERNRRRARARRGQDPDMVVSGQYHVNSVPPSMVDRREYMQEYARRKKMAEDEDKAEEPLFRPEEHEYNARKQIVTRAEQAQIDTRYPEAGSDWDHEPCAQLDWKNAQYNPMG